MTLQGSFNPSIESRPAVAYPSSINLALQSSSEDGGLGWVAQGAVGSITVGSASQAFTGGKSTKLTSNGTTGFFAMRLVRTFAELGGLGVFFTARVYVSPGNPAVGAPVQLFHCRPDGTIANAMSGGSLTLVAGWNYIQPGYQNTGGIGSSVVSGQYGLLLSVGVAFGASNAGMEIFVDDVLITPGAAYAPTAPAWEPANGEPLYRDGQSWVCTAPGTFSGLTLSTGDLVTATTALSYGTVSQVTWIKTDVITGAGAALAQKPIGFVGYPIGLGDWRIALQILLPEDSTSRWGVARWGQSIWPGLSWFDLSEWLRGASWKRGATSIGSRPEVGTCEITLENLELQFSPWNGISAFQDATIVDAAGVVLPGAFGPGTLMRLVGYSPSGMCNPFSGPADPLLPNSPDSWVGIFTGLVATWNDATTELGADRFVSIKLVELLSSLAQVDEPALTVAVGAADLPEIRLQRLLDAAGWKYGDVVDLFNYQSPLLSSAYQLQSTVMAQNRISEIYLTADSVDGVVRSGRAGEVLFYNAYPQQSWIPSGAGVRQGPDHSRISRVGPSYYDEPADVTYTVPYVGDSLQTANDDEVIQNLLAFGFVGGSVRTSSDVVSLQLYDPVSAGRTDLINSSTALIDAIMARTLSVRARLALRLEGLSLHSRLTGSLSALLSIDVDDVLDVELPPLLDGYRARITAADVLGMTHNLIPLPNGGGVVWTAQYSLGLQGALTLEAI